MIPREELELMQKMHWPDDIRVRKVISTALSLMDRVKELEEAFNPEHWTGSYGAEQGVPLASEEWIGMSMKGEEYERLFPQPPEAE